MRQICAALPPASASTARRFLSAWRAWPASASVSKRSASFQPTMPAMKTRRPSAAIPLLYPLGRGQPGGCSTCMIGLLPCHEPSAPRRRRSSLLSREPQVALEPGAKRSGEGYRLVALERYGDEHQRNPQTLLAGDAPDRLDLHRGAAELAQIEREREPVAHAARFAEIANHL